MALRAPLERIAITDYLDTTIVVEIPVRHDVPLRVMDSMPYPEFLSQASASGDDSDGAISAPSLAAYARETNPPPHVDPPSFDRAGRPLGGIGNVKVSGHDGDRGDTDKEEGEISEAEPPAFDFSPKHTEIPATTTSPSPPTPTAAPPDRSVRESLPEPPAGLRRVPGKRVFKKHTLPIEDAQSKAESSDEAPSKSAPVASPDDGTAAEFPDDFGSDEGLPPVLLSASVAAAFKHLWPSTCPDHPERRLKFETDEEEDDQKGLVRVRSGRRRNLIEQATLDRVPQEPVYRGTEFSGPRLRHKQLDPSLERRSLDHGATLQASRAALAQEKKLDGGSVLLGCNFSDLGAGPKRSGEEGAVSATTLPKRPRRPLRLLSGSEDENEEDGHEEGGVTFVSTAVPAAGRPHPLRSPDGAGALHFSPARNSTRVANSRGQLGSPGLSLPATIRRRLTFKQPNPYLASKVVNRPKTLRVPKPGEKHGSRNSAGGGDGRGAFFNAKQAPRRFKKSKSKRKMTAAQKRAHIEVLEKKILDARREAFPLAD